MPALMLGALLLVSGCSSDDGGDKKPKDGTTSTAKGGQKKGADPAAITLTPADGANAIDPQAPVTVAVVGGKLGEVKVVNAQNEPVDGALDADGKTWKPKVAFTLGGKYTITATATNADNAPTTARATFSTLSADKKVTARFSPEDGSTVGVGFPVSLTFDYPVTNKAAVEKALSVDVEPKVEGAWHWFDNTRVDFRPKDYWAPGTNVKVNLNLRGVDVGNGAIANQFKSYSFKIAPTKRIAVVDAKAHTMKVYENDQLVKTIPITAGESPKYSTWNGKMVVTEKFEKTRMNSQTVGLGSEYDIDDVPFAIRITTSGTFVHGNYWADPSVFGSRNTSHGCVSMTRENAKWFYDRVIAGDVVEVTGSDEDVVAADNGFGDWNLAWDKWTAGSASAGGTPTR
ncbi:Ig-like domain-containing protein [Embleya sp. NBC_00896]|uniref:L,D-transpeptidase n=1 Tax=Embleya sp. NBC_00896 TaxID=2975961 RepID=UPI003866D169|nr:Ig-like domain-containing protein [Embleya sp. NBC_00896]